MFPNIVSRSLHSTVITDSKETTTLIAASTNKNNNTKQDKKEKKASINIRSSNYLNTHITKRLVYQEFPILIGSALLLFYFLSSMSSYYQVMGAVRCPKIKKHAGIKLRPINKAKEPFAPNDMLLYTCESADHNVTQSIKCLDDGRWNELPHCPDPSNYTCPDIPAIDHGISNSTGPPHKVGSVVAFKCDYELFSNNPFLASTFSNTQAPASTTNSPNTNTFNSRITSSDNLTILERPLRYNLTGHRLLKCLPSKRWNHDLPSCRPIYPEPESRVGLVLTSTVIILVPMLILIVIIQLFIRWRKRQQQRERWKQYFTDYKYRHSKTSITFGMRPTSTATIPVTDL